MQETDLDDAIYQIEIRQYPAMTIVKTRVHGEHDRTISEAFLRLVSYSTGNNHEHRSIEMISTMFTECEEGDSWDIWFILPGEVDTAYVPEPIDVLVQICQLPAQLKAVISYTGVNTEEKIQDFSRTLLSQVKKNRAYRACGKPCSAQYEEECANSMIEGIKGLFVRRNEVMVEVQPTN